MVFLVGSIAELIAPEIDGGGVTGCFVITMTTHLFSPPPQAAHFKENRAVTLAAMLTTLVRHGRMADSACLGGSWC